MTDELDPPVRSYPDPPDPPDDHLITEAGLPHSPGAPLPVFGKFRRR